MKDKIKVLVVDDHNIVRDGLKLILNFNEQIEVCAEAGSITETLFIIPKVNPDVILLDFKLPDGDGVNGCISIKNQFPNVKIIILTAYSQEHLIIETIKAGADGYLLKNIKSDELIKSIINVYNGGSVLDPSVTSGVFNIMARKDKAEQNILSPRETEILEMLSFGKSNKEIAHIMSISDKTVRNYISNIFKKINVSNRTEAASYWLREKTTN